MGGTRNVNDKEVHEGLGAGLAGVAGATTLALSLIGVLPVATTAPAAQAAPAPAPVCAEITPASLNATYTDVSGRPHIVTAP